MKSELFVDNLQSTLLTVLRPGLTLLEMSREIFTRNVQITILTIFWFHRAIQAVSLELSFPELGLAMLALLSGMVLLFMFFIKVFVVRLSTYCALDNISTTVPEVSRVFGLLYFFLAILADFHYYLYGLFIINKSTK